MVALLAWLGFEPRIFGLTYSYTTMWCNLQYKLLEPKNTFYAVQLHHLLLTVHNMGRAYMAHFCHSETNDVDSVFYVYRLNVILEI